MYINRQLQELNLKIVYAGPPLSGKTTNLEHIHGMAAPETRGQLVSLKTQEDRTLFFDFMQLELGKVGGLRPKFNLYTVPGQAQYAVTRKIVLRGADGVVFVADSGPDRLKDNVQAWKQLHEHLAELKINSKDFPLVVQFNKQDLADALPSPIMKAVMGITTAQCIDAAAINEQGVRETLKAIIGQVLKQVAAQPQPQKAR